MVWIIAVLLNLLGIGSASAESAVVVVKAAGTDYNGPPTLRLLADGRLIGERVLQKAVSTTRQKSKYADRKKAVEWLKFEVPALDRIAKLEIEFSNDASAGNGIGDRNLYIYGVIINGYRFPVTLLRHVPTSSGGTWGDEAQIWSNGRLQLVRPEKGWRRGYKAATPK
jgi:hypothetical protein